MGFKKNYINKKNHKSILNIIGIISIGIVFIIALILIKNIDLIKIIIDENNVLKTEIPEEKGEEIIIGNKEISKDYINILLTGRGGGLHDAPNLTDTIILARIDSKNKLITMLSLPRDLYVEYPGKNKKGGKINGLYASYSFEKKSKEIGMKILKEKITEITGEEIDFFIDIDFNGFKDIIDTIGGIEIDIPQNFVDNQYPDGNWGYKTLIFKKGIWLFDGENALKYVRSRHSTSDFDRSLRQQQVIKSIKNKLTGSYFITSPGKIKELYKVFKSNVYTDLTLTKVIKIAYSISGKNDYEIVSSNMNDSCFYGSSTCDKGGILYIPSRELFNGMSVLLIEGSEQGNLSNYKASKKYSDIIFNYHQIIKENAKINIFNSLKVNHLAGALSNDIKKYGFYIPEKNSIGNTQKVYSKSVIYYNNLSKDSQTLKLLKQFFSGEFKKIASPKYSKDNANIEIIIGEDFLEQNKILKF